ncbi:hypothetical protein PBRA_005617 [Plasmodiophora brassicae]|uniref:Uncharacterized protein n=1 Tax=Plasmodiophora brassicae TaxID=37360 RepID=A0A0G4INZ0_PLABS|nr:hypothetical protein PBRA_005617 [Plasmodiophora brassicae]
MTAMVLATGAVRFCDDAHALDAGDGRGLGFCTRQLGGSPLNAMAPAIDAAATPPANIAFCAAVER